MCAGIMKLSNALIYGDRLRCGSPHVEYAKLKLLNGRPVSSWLKKVLDADKPVIFINTDALPAFETKDHKTVSNPIEACIVAEITEALANHGVAKEEIQSSFIRRIMVSSCKTLTTVPLPNLLIEKVDEQSGIFCMSKNDIKSKTELKRCSHTT